MKIQKKKTLYNVKILKEFLESEDENRNIENIPQSELQELSIKFALGVRTQ